MHQYDITLKLLLRGGAGRLLTALSGTTVTKWLNVELPELRNTRVDMLGETASAAEGGLLPISSCKARTTHPCRSG